MHPRPIHRAGIFLERRNRYRGFEWKTDEMIEIDKRALNPWFTAIVVPKKMARRPATMYLATTADENGKTFEAGKICKTKYLGDLKFVDGFPTDATLEKCYDFLDTSRARTMRWCGSK